FKPADKTKKLSQYVIDEVRTAILDGRLKPGQRLASEKQLTDQFDVSKGTMREALRCLDAMGLIKMKKGPKGGIFIAEVDMNTTVHSLLNFLHFRNVSVSQITILRYLLEPYLAEIAAPKISQSDIHILASVTNEEAGSQCCEVPKGIGFHYHIARFSENPLFILLMDFIEHLLFDLKIKLRPDADFYRMVTDDHYRIIHCFQNRDGVGARSAMAKHVLHVGEYLARLAGETYADVSAVSSSRRRDIPASMPAHFETLASERSPELAPCVRTEGEKRTPSMSHSLSYDVRSDKQGPTTTSD
ncbi:MAG: FadR/GntR family transcriptional regulator, partial [Desulfomonilaceae bacterium]